MAAERYRSMCNQSPAQYQSIAITSAGITQVIVGQANQGIALLALFLSVAGNVGGNAVSVVLASNQANITGPTYLGSPPGLITGTLVNTSQPPVIADRYFLDLHDNPLVIGPLTTPGNSFNLIVSGTNINVGGYVEYVQGQT